MMIFFRNSSILLGEANLGIGGELGFTGLNGNIRTREIRQLGNSAVVTAGDSNTLEYEKMVGSITGLEG